MDANRHCRLDVPLAEDETLLDITTNRLWAEAYGLPELLRRASARDVEANRATLIETAAMIEAALEVIQ